MCGPCRCRCGVTVYGQTSAFRGLALGALMQAWGWADLCCMLLFFPPSSANPALDMCCVPGPGLSPGCTGERGVHGSDCCAAYFCKVPWPLAVRRHESVLKGSSGSEHCLPLAAPESWGAERVPGAGAGGGHEVIFLLHLAHWTLCK